MRVTVVGSGDAFGSGGRFQTCIALGPATGPPATAHTLIDCGATSLVALKQQGFDPHSIETVLISHLHADHFGGLPFLILDGQFRRRTTDLTIAGPPGTEQRLAEMMEASFPGSAGIRRRFTVRVTEHRQHLPWHTGRFTVTPYQVRHAAGAPAYALRIEDAHSPARIAYSGDTEWTDTLIDASADTGLFLCEGYSPTPLTGHLDLATLHRERHRLTTDRLVLTHASPTTLHADLTGWELAHDGWTTTV